MLNVFGLILAFIDLWLIATIFSSTATDQDRAVIYVVAPIAILITLACFYFANRPAKSSNPK